jgi:hypothetical protein
MQQTVVHIVVKMDNIKIDNAIPFGQPPLFLLIAHVVGKNLLSFQETPPIILSLGEPFPTIAVNLSFKSLLSIIEQVK